MKRVKVTFSSTLGPQNSLLWGGIQKAAAHIILFSGLQMARLNTEHANNH